MPCATCQKARTTGNGRDKELNKPNNCEDLKKESKVVVEPAYYDHGQIFQLKRELFQINQGSQSITQLDGLIKGKLDELNKYEPITSDLEILKQRYENDHVYLLLNALNSDYEQIRREILSSRKLPTISNVVSLLRKEERRTTMNLKTQTTYNAVEKSGSIVDRNQGDRNSSCMRGRGTVYGTRSIAQCDHCAKDGHSRDRCWVLYPHLPEKEETRKTMKNLNTQTTENAVEKSLLVDRNQGGRNSISMHGRGTGHGIRSIAHCDHCSKDGHSRDECWFLHPHLRGRRSRGQRLQQPPNSSVNLTNSPSWRSANSCNKW